jgi:6,7-dimethyl-8-ribityllumazine synthase
MAKVYEGQISSAGLKVAIVAGRFNNFIVDRLVEGAVDAVVRTGGSDDDISIYRCPGAFELPQVARKVVERGGIDALICVGAVIRGSTPHFEHVANSVTRGISVLAGTAEVPVTFGILTTDTIEQAIERAGTKAGNKGYDSAMAAIEMASLYKSIDAK